MDAGMEADVALVVERGLQYWEQHSCLTFEWTDPADLDPEKDAYLVFVRKGGCASYKGMQGGAQPVYIGNRCEKVTCSPASFVAADTQSWLSFQFGIVTHEIGHALGLWHEHQRPDRDSHLTILFDNIRSDRSAHFTTPVP